MVLAYYSTVPLVVVHMRIVERGGVRPRGAATHVRVWM